MTTRTKKSSSQNKPEKEKESIYTKPKLREKIKDKIKDEAKGAKPGQWSARKSQMLVKEYEKQGGAYKNKTETKLQKSLKTWADEEWQTRSGEKATKDNSPTKRYLPKETWESLSDDEKKSTENIKQNDSRRGKQYVKNTDEVKKARKKR
jgi:hypothetical protein